MTQIAASPDTFEPTKAIVLYKTRNNEHYAEVHHIENGDFKEGRPLTIEELSGIKEMATKKNAEIKNDCFAYRNILGFELNGARNRIVWIYPAGERKLYYREGMDGFVTGKYFLPNLIFDYNSGSLSVYAIKASDIPKMNPETQLYTAPFFNTNSIGNVCMGSAKVKKSKNFTEMVRNVEAAFFNSEFTHTSTNKIVKGNLLDAYTDQKKKFDEKLLLPSVKLKKLLK